MFQVVAVYPSGNEYDVRGPHSSIDAAASHARRCLETNDPRDTHWYEIREIVRRPVGFTLTAR